MERFFIYASGHVKNYMTLISCLHGNKTNGSRMITWGSGQTRVLNKLLDTVDVFVTPSPETLYFRPRTFFKRAKMVGLECGGEGWCLYDALRSELHRLGVYMSSDHKSSHAKSLYHYLLQRFQSVDNYCNSLKTIIHEINTEPRIGGENPRWGTDSMVKFCAIFFKIETVIITINGDVTNLTMLHIIPDLDDVLTNPLSESDAINLLKRDDVCKLISAHEHWRVAVSQDEPVARRKYGKKVSLEETINKPGHVHD